MISHGHNDHTGGLLEALRSCGRRIPVILHPDALLLKLKTVPALRAIGAPHRWEQVEEVGCLLATREPLALVVGVQTSGEVPAHDIIRGAGGIPDPAGRTRGAGRPAGGYVAVHLPT